MSTALSREVVLKVSKAVSSLCLALSLCFCAVIAMGYSVPVDADEPSNEPVCVTVPKARLRAGPSTSSKITWLVGRNMPLERIGTENGWSQVRDLRGQIHWVISRNVSANETCAVVRVRSATLHRGAGSSQPRADFMVADRYTPFKRVEREGGWVRLEDEYSGSYWTRASNVWMPVKRTRMNF